MRATKYVGIALLCLPLLAHKCGGGKKEKEVEKAVETSQESGGKLATFNDKALDKMESYPDSLILRLQRNACFGTCPVDITEIYASGYLVYTPMIHGVRENISSAWIGQDEIEVLRVTAKEVKFFEMEDKYDANIPDLPGSRFYVTMDGKSKEVDVVSGTPEQIRPLLNRYNILLKNIENWKDLGPAK